MGKLLAQVQPHDLLKFGIIPELVGRLPVITSLQNLTKEDLIRILTEPKNALSRQYQKLLELDRRALAQFGTGPLGQFKQNWSVERLDTRFAEEDGQTG